MRTVVENGKVDKKAFDRICKFIDAQDKSGWPAGFQDDSKKICQLWLDDGHAPTAEFAAIASKMQLKNSRLWSFIDLVYNELGLLPEPDVMDLYDPEDDWAEIVPVPDSCPPVKKCKNYEVMSKDCVREAVSLYRMGQIAQNRLDAGEVNGPKEKKKQSLIADKGTQALRLLVLGNLSMVINVADVYSGDQDITDAMLMDGQEGLTNAVILFVPKQLSFFAYAVIWVRKYILDGIAARGRRQEEPQGQEDSEDRDYSEVLDRIGQFVQGKRKCNKFPARLVKDIENACQKWLRDGHAQVLDVAYLIYSMDLKDGDIASFINLIYGDLGVSAEPNLGALLCTADSDDEDYLNEYELEMAAEEDLDFHEFEARAAEFEGTAIALLDSYQACAEAQDTLMYSDELSKEDRLNLREIIIEGFESKESLVSSMAGLIVRIAQKCVDEPTPLCFLVEDGTQGLYNAIKHFGQNGIPFLTFASAWICAAMLSGIDSRYS